MYVCMYVCVWKKRVAVDDIGGEEQVCMCVCVYVCVYVNVCIKNEGCIWWYEQVCVYVYVCVYMYEKMRAAFDYMGADNIHTHSSILHTLANTLIKNEETRII